MKIGKELLSLMYNKSVGASIKIIIDTPTVFIFLVRKNL
jgi:hypothetical protein